MSFTTRQQISIIKNIRSNPSQNCRGGVGAVVPQSVWNFEAKKHGKRTGGSETANLK
jgi:hypothetical protein